MWSRRTIRAYHVAHSDIRHERLLKIVISISLRALRLLFMDFEFDLSCGSCCLEWLFFVVNRCGGVVRCWSI